MVVAPVKVLFAGVVQSTWNFHSRNVFEAPTPMNMSGVPGGGRNVPSIVLGRSVRSLRRLPPGPKETIVAARPASIARRSSAITCATEFVSPSVKSLNVM